MRGATRLNAFTSHDLPLRSRSVRLNRRNIRTVNTRYTRKAPQRHHAALFPRFTCGPHSSQFFAPSASTSSMFFCVDAICFFNISTFLSRKASELSTSSTASFFAMREAENGLLRTAFLKDSRRDENGPLRTCLVYHCLQQGASYFSVLTSMPPNTIKPKK